MSFETIVAVFDTAAHAAAAVQDLVSAGVPSDAITQHANNTVTGSAATTATPGREQGFWSSLLGGEPEQSYDSTVYDRSMEGGSTVVSVQTPTNSVTQVSAILERHNPVDIDERAASYNSTQTTTSTTAAPVAISGQASVASGVSAERATDSGTIQLAEESLVVGKRALNQGSTRVRRYVVETPVEEQVTLHDERVVVDRRPVTDGRPLADGSFSDKTIEMVETREEAVVSKTARVVEEINLRKEGVDRVETVRDTVRREDIAVEQVPGEMVTSTTGTMTPASPIKPKI